MRAELPDATLLYAADNAAFPYGAWDEPALVERIVTVVGTLIERTEPDLVVIACNTASTLALAALREHYTLPFVGTVPAIKPAAAQTKSGLIGVLATPGTVKREYTQRSSTPMPITARCSCMAPSGSPRSPRPSSRATSVDEAELRDEIAPVFRNRDGKRTDVVVLGCTHYPLLTRRDREVAPWPVTYIDPAPAIARRVSDVLRTTTRGGG